MMTPPEGTETAPFTENCERAAKTLHDADVLLIVTGAGFSADSGLAVYGDIAKVQAYQSRGLDYADVSMPSMIDKDPELYFGFWGQALNDYRATQPHGGYAILSRWRRDKCGHQSISKAIQEEIEQKATQQNVLEDEEVQRLTPYASDGSRPAGAFHVFTSNVDAHMFDYFHANEINNCHGNIELWQCSSRDCTSGIWRAPLQHKFLVDTSTMLAPEFVTDPRLAPQSSDVVVEEDATIPLETTTATTTTTTTAAIGQTQGKDKRDHNVLSGMPPGKDTTGWRVDEGSNWPKCGHCGSLARPSIFCFGDFGWKWDKSEEIRWDLWKETILDLVGQQHDEGLRLCIVEIGCGTNVETCRVTSEQLLEDVLKKGGNATIVRINPDFPFAPEGSVSENHTIPIRSRGLPALKQIDLFYSSFGKQQDQCD